MRNLVRRHALMGLCVTLAGCTPEQKVVTQSNAAGVSGQKLNRVLIGIRARGSGLTATQNESLLQPAELKHAFETKWPPLGIAVEIVDGDSVRENGGGASLLAAAHARFQPSQMLLLQPSQIQWRGPYIRDYEIDARLFDATARKLIWRAGTELQDFWRISASSSRRLEAADRYVDSLTTKLKEDGLI